jgi:hypothetical protein
VRARSLKKKTHALSWRRNQFSIVLSDDITALVMADAEREISALSVVIRRILADYYRQRGALPEPPPTRVRLHRRQ